MDETTAKVPHRFLRPLGTEIHENVAAEDDIRCIGVVQKRGINVFG
jgi:hypothetical protein